ncbi:MAG: DUF2793 domain-containing protein [Pseudomonadota bacterium]
MTDPVSFSSSSTVFDFPLLFSGQAQKEIFVNQTFSMIDALLSRVIVGSSSTPPSSPSDGDVYLVEAPASGDWTGRAESLALRVGGAWRFVEPREGMSVFNKSSGRSLVFRSAWEFAQEPVAPSGGSVIDTEGRLALSHLIGELKKVGIIG